MRQNGLNPSLVIAGIILFSILIFDVYLFFEKTAITAKILASGSFIGLCLILIPYSVRLIKSLKNG